MYKGYEGMRDGYKVNFLLDVENGIICSFRGRGIGPDSRPRGGNFQTGETCSLTVNIRWRPLPSARTDGALSGWRHQVTGGAD